MNKHMDILTIVIAAVSAILLIKWLKSKGYAQETASCDDTSASVNVFVPGFSLGSTTAGNFGAPQAMTDIQGGGGPPLPVRYGDKITLNMVNAAGESGTWLGSDPASDYFYGVGQVSYPQYGNWEKKPITLVVDSKTLGVKARGRPIGYGDLVILTALYMPPGWSGKETCQYTIMGNTQIVSGHTAPYVLDPTGTGEDNKNYATSAPMSFVALNGGTSQPSKYGNGCSTSFMSYGDKFFLKYSGVNAEAGSLYLGAMASQVISNMAYYGTSGKTGDAVTLTALGEDGKIPTWPATVTADYNMSTWCAQTSSACAAVPFPRSKAWSVPSLCGTTTLAVGSESGAPPPKSGNMDMLLIAAGVAALLLLRML
jgi:hypothetical protein